uniref:Uncharacterized protein n=1 Tax=Arundo donax TaxID=35708 RepID=A0A0A9GE34_ARUDO
MTETALTTFLIPLKSLGSSASSFVTSPIIKSMSGPNILLALSSFLANTRTGSPFLRKDINHPSPNTTSNSSDQYNITCFHFLRRFARSRASETANDRLYNLQFKEKHQHIIPQTEGNTATNRKFGGKTLRGFGGQLKKYNVLTNLPMSQDCWPAKAIISLHDSRDDGARLAGRYVIRGNCFEPRKGTF